MASIKPFLLCLVLLFGQATFSEEKLPDASSITKEPEQISIGLIFFSPPLSKDMDFTPTLRYLQKAMAPQKVKATVYSSDKLEELVKTGAVDFFFASSGFYWRMLPFGVRNIASIIIEEKPDPNKGTAGAFITRIDRKDISHLEDMRGKSILLNYSTGFHGNRTGMAEIARRGWDPDSFFSEKKFVGENGNFVIEKLLDGQADVGYVRACWLEEFANLNEDIMEKIKVVEPRSGPIACLHSTDYYPNNTLASTYKVSNELAKRITVALLTMPMDEYGQSWSIATDFKPVDNLYKNLKEGPYSYLREWSFRVLWQKYWPFVTMLLMAILGLIAHSWRAERLVEKRTQQLVEETNRRKELEKQAEVLIEKMETQQKLNLVGHLSSMFAHEMNQPLAAFTYFLDGIKALVKNKTIDPELLDYSITQMKSEINRASAIVQKVRNYAKTEASRTDRINATEIISEVTKTLETKYNGTITFEQTGEKDIFVLGDGLEIQLLFWNLLKNAAEAASEAEEPKITIDISKEDSIVLFDIQNNGHKLTTEDLE